MRRVLNIDRTGQVCIEPSFAPDDFRVIRQLTNGPPLDYLPIAVILDCVASVLRRAHVFGHLTQPIYLSDHEVIPAGALVSGSIRGTHPAKTKEHIRRFHAADFTPPRLPDIVYDSLILPAQSEHASSTVAIVAPAEQTNASALTLGTKAQRRSSRAARSSKGCFRSVRV